MADYWVCSAEHCVNSQVGVIAVLCGIAAFHRPSLVPISVLMALIGYALGNYLAPLTGHLARLAVGQ